MKHRRPWAENVAAEVGKAVIGQSVIVERLLVALLPATATVIGVVVLRQLPSLAELAGVGLVVLSVALHRERPASYAPDRKGMTRCDT